jgi:hypothetical protein
MPKLHSFRCINCWAEVEVMRTTEQADDPPPKCDVVGCSGDTKPWNYPSHSNEAGNWGRHHQGGDNAE